jgi:hypothetical protein
MMDPPEISFIEVGWPGMTVELWKALLNYRNVSTLRVEDPWPVLTTPTQVDTSESGESAHANRPGLERLSILLPETAFFLLVDSGS